MTIGIQNHRSTLFLPCRVSPCSSERDGTPSKRKVSHLVKRLDQPVPHPQDAAQASRQMIYQPSVNVICSGFVTVMVVLWLLLSS